MSPRSSLLVHSGDPTALGDIADLLLGRNIHAATALTLSGAVDLGVALRPERVLIDYDSTARASLVAIREALIPHTRFAYFSKESFPHLYAETAESGQLLTDSRPIPLRPQRSALRGGGRSTNRGGLPSIHTSRHVEPMESKVNTGRGHIVAQPTHLNHSSKSEGIELSQSASGGIWVFHYASLLDILNWCSGELG